MTKKIQALGPLQEKWLTILESGLLKQTTGRLCEVKEKQNGDVDLEFCCLGIAEHFVMQHPYEAVEGILLYTAGGQEEGDVLTNVTVKKMKFHAFSGDPVPNGPTLASWNDSGHTFIEIAALVRKDPSKYFKGPA